MTSNLSTLAFVLILAVSATHPTRAQTPNGKDSGRVVATSGHGSELPASYKRNPGIRSLASQSPSANTVTLLGSAVTASPAESFAINGNYAYVCDDREVSVINIANPANPQVVGTALSSLIQNSGNIHCSIQRNTLTVFADQSSSLAGNSPGFIAFSLSNPLVPALIQATPINKRFFQDPVYIGNVAFLPTSALTYFLKIQWDGQFGDLISVDLSNFSSPTLLGTLETPNLNPVFGGANVALGAIQADTSLLYVGGSTSTSNLNNGVGKLQVVDVSTPSAMKAVGQILIPGSILFYAPLIQGTTAVGIGNTGGYVGQITAGQQGNIVVATFDVSDRRSPALLSTTTTTYKVGPGGGATRIGSNLFAFAGVVDANNNPVLLVVDVTNPSAPVFSNFPISQPFTSMQAAGNVLYATLGAGGFATYAIPGITTIPLSSCPASMDVTVVVDQGAAVSSQAFLDGKSALKSFIDAMHLAPDQAGLISFTTTATVNQTLNTSGTLVKSKFDAIVASPGNSYVGSGIAAAQTELTGSRHNPSATQIMIVLSDGADKGAPNSTATVAAANAAKAAGIRVISLQYGSGTAGTLMQSIASSTGDYYVVGQ